MSVNAKNQLEDIHSMLASGHRSFLMERHTLILWGLAGALLILIVPVLFAPEHFDLRWHRMVLQNLFIASVLVVTGVLDFKLTRRVRAQRNESLSFVQRQLSKVWWLLVGLVVVINIGMNFFGGGYIFFAVMLMITGLALYIQGLFSQQMLCWVGVMMMVVGLFSVALKIPHPVMQWLAASVLGLGLPAVAWMIHRPCSQWSMSRRLTVSLLWLAIVITPATVAYQLSITTGAPDLPTVSLQQYMKSSSSGEAEPQVVYLPAGTVIPVSIDIGGDILEGHSTGTLDMILSRDLELIIEDDKPAARFRVDGGVWKHRLYNYRMQRTKSDVTVTREHGPRVSVQMQISTSN